MIPAVLRSFGVVVAKNYPAAFMRRLARWGGFIWDRWEQRQLEIDAGNETPHQPVFIVGAPRTGSTILYQLLSHHFDLLYIDNLTALFFRHLMCGLRISDYFWKHRPHHCFQSNQGDTSGCGLHGPAECGDFWYRWLPREKHYIAANEIPGDSIEQMRTIIFAAMNRWHKHFLFKNLNAGQRMAMIHQITPRAKFIWITREPLYTAQSILQVRKKLNIPAHTWWSIMPKNTAQLLDLEPDHMIAAQIYYLEKQINQDQTLFPEDQFTRIQYETLCKQPKETLETLSRFIGAPPRTHAPMDALTPLPFDEKQRISDTDFNRLAESVSQYDWKNYEQD
jgi:hypothetical protein